MIRFERQRVLVVGAGVAGSAAAIRLDPARFDVTMVDRATFPRFKVCGGCLGVRGRTCFERLGVWDSVRPVCRDVDRWRGYADGATVTLAIPPGIAVAREDLDGRMHRRCVERGVTFLSPCDARLIAAENDAVAVTIKHDDQSRSERFDWVIAASGLAGLNLSGAGLGWVDPPSGPFGAAFRIARVSGLDERNGDRTRGDGDGCDGNSRGIIHMVCGDDGYVGLVRLVDGSFEVAAAIHGPATMTRRSESKSRGDGGSVAASDHHGRCDPLDRINRWLAEASMAIDRDDLLTPVLTTPPLRRRRRSVGGRVIAIGDAAGYVEPFTGQGMTWAMESAIELADAMNIDPAAAATRWRRRSIGADQKRCGWITRQLRHPAKRSFAIGALRYLPWVAGPIARRMTA